MKALVTGGSGFIGSHIASLLLSHNHEVTVLDSSESSLPERARGATLIRASITDAKKVEEACRGCDWVFHEAAIVSVPESFKDPAKTKEVNVGGTLNVLEACRKNDVGRMALASSAAIYGDAPGLPKKETDAPSPQSPYGESKLQNELDARRYFEEYSLKAVSLRYFNVYGPGQKAASQYSGVISRFLHCALHGERPTIYGDGTQTRDFVFAKDVAEANLLCAESEKAPGEVFNIAGGSAISLIELWDKIAAVSGCNLEPVFEEKREGDILHSLASIEKASTLLGYKPATSLNKGLSETLDWMKAENGEEEGGE
jgi:nucleoside-diphosphate-sugar epimerase